MMQHAAASESVKPEIEPTGAARQTLSTTILGLQHTAGNGAVSKLVNQLGSPRRAQVQRPSRMLHRCALGTCSCGHECITEHREDTNDEQVSRALREAVQARTLARQHTPGGPYHPPAGTPMSCTMNDSCPEISTKINYLRHTIRRHLEWDQANPDPAWPDGRHAAEIADLQRALGNCVLIASTKCRNQPEWVPVPVESPDERTERVKRQLYEALPWAVAVVVIGLVVACVIAEPCGAVVLAAVAAVAGEEALATVIAILAGNGVRLATS
jgi:hypothetical protein